MLAHPGETNSGGFLCLGTSFTSSQMNLGEQAMTVSLKMDDLREERAQARRNGFEFLRQEELEAVEAEWRELHDQIAATEGGPEFLARI